MKTWFKDIPRFIHTGDVGPTPPSGSWPTSSPEDQGMSSEKLNRIRTAYIGDAVLIRNGVLIREWGASRERREWASCGRSVVATTVWGVAITNGDMPGGIELLDQLLADWGTPVAQSFKPGSCLHHPLSYTRPGESWGYAKDWRIQDDLFCEREVNRRKMHDYFNERVGPSLPGIDAKENAPDGTPRFNATPYDAARWGQFWHSGPVLVSPEFVSRSLAGGPTGDPGAIEGYQIHLIRNGRAWELNMTGVPDGYMARDGGQDPNNPDAGGGSHGAIIVIPSLEIVVAYRSYYPCDYFMRDICAAVL